MSFWYALSLFLCVICGYILYPYTFKYLKSAYSYFFINLDEAKDDAFKKLNRIEEIVKRQIEIGKDKGEDITEETKDILNDLEEIWNIIKR